jgi:hypothetical protein
MKLARFGSHVLACETISFRRSVGVTRGFRHVAILISVFLRVFCGIGRAQTDAQPVREQKWTLVWSDEFNGPNGSGADAAKWTLEVGGDA